MKEKYLKKKFPVKQLTNNFKVPRKVESAELSEVIRHTPAKKDCEKKHGKSKMADNKAETVKEKAEKEKKEKSVIPAVAESSASSSDDRPLIDILKNTRTYCKAQGLPPLKKKPKATTSTVSRSPDAGMYKICLPID